MTGPFCKRIVGKSRKKFNEEGKVLEYEKREITKKQLKKVVQKLGFRILFLKLGNSSTKLKGKS